MPTPDELAERSERLAPLSIDDLCTVVVSARYHQTNVMSAINSLLNLVSTLTVHCEVDHQLLVVDAMRDLGDALERPHLKNRKLH